MLCEQRYLLNQEDKNASILLKELFDGFSYDSDRRHPYYLWFDLSNGKHTINVLA